MKRVEERGLKFKRYGPNAFGLVNILGWCREPTMYCANPILSKEKDLPSLLQQRKDIQTQNIKCLVKHSILLKAEENTDSAIRNV